jgi:hypothetical protein
MKSRSGSKILEFWVWEAFLLNFQGKISNPLGLFRKSRLLGILWREIGRVSWKVPVLMRYHIKWILLKFVHPPGHQLYSKKLTKNPTSSPNPCHN